MKEKIIFDMRTRKESRVYEHNGVETEVSNTELSAFVEEVKELKGLNFAEALQEVTEDISQTAHVANMTYEEAERRTLQMGAEKFYRRKKEGCVGAQIFMPDAEELRLRALAIYPSGKVGQ